MSQKRILTRRRFLVEGTAAALTLAGCSRRQPPVRVVPAKAAAPTVRFTDVTAEAGLSFVQSRGGCGLYYFIEQETAGAAVFDANGDGHLDIYFPQPKPLGVCKAKYKEPLRHRLYLNNGDGTFRLAPEAFGGVETDYGLAAAVGDYNNDGHPDLFVACYGQSKLFRNRGDGTFADVTEKAGVGVKGVCMGAVWFDYDGDGYLDLYVIRYAEWSVDRDVPCYGPDRTRNECNPVMYPPSTNLLFHNNGDGTFTDVTAKAGVGSELRRSQCAAAFDFDGDGHLDLFVANDLGPNSLYHNNGNGTFTDVAMQQNVAFGLTGQSQANMGIAVGDYDGDGDLDVLVTTFSNEPYTLYRNDGGYFTDVSAAAGIAQSTLPFLGFGTGFFDARNSGLLDLFFANGHVFHLVRLEDPHLTYKQRNQLLLNDGSGHFVEALNALPQDDVRVHRGTCFGDFNNDGRIDILVTANDDRPTLLRNDSPPANWLLLKLINKHGCVTPIGTRCTATVNGRRLLRVVLGGGSWGGESDHRVHFGLGSAPRVERLEIRWLSGKTQALTDVPANQILTVHEN
ncbi:MAG TPA: CRTAC1 family protein [Chthonomonadaceae bacterium]|nr:CRTAC1 family protein [Chthonomonadaceae bacterium]